LINIKTDNMNDQGEYQITDDDINVMIENVDLDGNHEVDKEDFLMAAVDLSEKPFLKYCEIAYDEMFNNEHHMIDK